MTKTYLLLFLIFGFISASAQTDPVTGEHEVTGTVTDRSGLPIAGANLFVSRNGGNRTFSALHDGTFKLKLQPGDFEITAGRTTDPKFRMFLTVPANGIKITGLNITLDPASACCFTPDGTPYPKPISLPRAPYPIAAHAVRATGEVVVKVSLDGSGNVANAEAVSGHPLLRINSVNAAERSKFEPGTVNELFLTYVYLVGEWDEPPSRTVHSNIYRITMYQESIRLIDSSSQLN